MKCATTRATRLASALGACLIVMGLAPLGRAQGPTTLDCSAASEQARVLRTRGQLRAARAQLFVCAAPSCPDDSRTECLRRGGELDVAMPTIVFEAADAAGREVVAVAVKMDGEPLTQRLDGTALSIDPGRHAFSFEAPGQPVVTKQLLILEGEKYRREHFTLGRIVAPPGSEGAPRRRAVKTASLVLGGLGVAAVAVGFGYGLVAISRRDEAVRSCPSACSTDADVERWNRARAAGDVSTVTFAVGGVALASGLVLWLVARHEAEISAGAQLAFGPGGVTLRGQW
jgi:hypothetical protein